MVQRLRLPQEELPLGVPLFGLLLPLQHPYLLLQSPPIPCLCLHLGALAAEGDRQQLHRLCIILMLTVCMVNLYLV